MATSSMVPYSNPAGKNQTSPSSTVSGLPTSGLPVISPTNPGGTVATNPLIPANATPGTSTGPAQTVTNPTSVPTGISSNSVIPGAVANSSTPIVGGDAYNQLHDIYGAAGGTLTDFMNSISGTNSTALQEYIKSLAPQEATAQANLNASLGAGGVSANSSVAALGNANLQAQEFAAISGESAKLTESQQQLEAGLISNTLPAAEKQVADSSPWAIFGDILGAVGSVAGDVMGLGDISGGFGLGKKSSSVPSNGSLPSGYGSAAFEG